MMFDIKLGTRKPVNQLENHLVEQAKLWVKGRAKRAPLKTLAHFQNALQLERDEYCASERGFRPSSVSIHYRQQGEKSEVWICSAEKPDVPSAVISLTHEGIDHQQIQDSLLIPLRR